MPILVLNLNLDLNLDLNIDLNLDLNLDLNINPDLDPDPKCDQCGAVPSPRPNLIASTLTLTLTPES